MGYDFSKNCMCRHDTLPLCASYEECRHYRPNLTNREQMPDEHSKADPEREMAFVQFSTVDVQHC